MYYDMRIYTLKPGSTKEFLERFAEVLPTRLKYSELTGFWYTDAGALNQVIHVWEYKDGVDRMKVREAVSKDSNWPPKVREFIVSQENMLLKPAGIVPTPMKGELGAIYEMRQYTFKPGKIPLVNERWAVIIEERKKISPLAACWFTDVGPANTWIHLWPYPDMNARDVARAAQGKLDGWPPDTREFMETQQNRILIPAPFSPMR
ncbi:NIPSNAP family protein [Nitrospinota bacterium]